MKKITLAFLACFLFTFSSCDVVSEVLDTAVNTPSGPKALTNSDIIGGLKEALKKGTSRGVNTLSVEDGFFKNQAVKVLFPPEAKKMENKLRQLGAGSLVDKAILKINRAAENAASKAKPIFVNAITSMTIQDAMGILKGEKNACTQYLKRTTSQSLFNAFNPVINESLNQVGALDAWTAVVSRYNKIPFVEKVNPDLDDYVTNKTMDGLFMMIEKEERSIRKDPLKRTTDLLKRVFAKQD